MSKREKWKIRHYEFSTLNPLSIIMFYFNKKKKFLIVDTLIRIIRYFSIICVIWKFEKPDGKLGKL